jgi:hypothetical protein
MASTWPTPCASAWARKSGEVSTRIDGPSLSVMKMEARERVSRGSVDRQVAHPQPIIGTPCDVPDPRTSTFAVDKLKA